MDLHGIHANPLRKEITCSDCGHHYFVAQGQPSSLCSQCGNVEYLSSATEAPFSLSSLSQTLVSKRVLPRLQATETPAIQPDPLLAFQTTPDGKVVEEIRIRYQVEWQLWSVLVKHFHDPAYHAAYLAQALVDHSLTRASERYSEHRTVMSYGKSEHWQSEVAELMLSRIEALSAVRMQQEANGGLRLPDWFLLAFQGQAPRLIWVVLGMMIVARMLWIRV